jgi:hypothetical protein
MNEEEEASNERPGQFTMVEGDEYQPPIDEEENNINTET